MRRPLLAASMLLWGCGPSTAPAPSVVAAEPAREPAGETVDGCFVGPGAPDPQSCASDDDCTVGGLFLADSCCLSGVSHPHSRAYHAWQTEAFRARCDGSCIESPSAPEPCELAVRCEARRCVNACSDVPTATDGALDAMDRAELETLCEGGSTAACDRLGH